MWSLVKCATSKKGGKALTYCSNTTKRHRLVGGSSEWFPNLDTLFGCDQVATYSGFGDLILEIHSNNLECTIEPLHRRSMASRMEAVPPFEGQLLCIASTAVTNGWAMGIGHLDMGWQTNSGERRGAAQETKTWHRHPSCLTLVLPCNRAWGCMMAIPRPFLVASTWDPWSSRLCPSIQWPHSAVQWWHGPCQGSLTPACHFGHSVAGQRRSKWMESWYCEVLGLCHGWLTKSREPRRKWVGHKAVVLCSGIGWHHGHTVVLEWRCTVALYSENRWWNWAMTGSLDE